MPVKSTSYRKSLLTSADYAASPACDQKATLQEILGTPYFKIKESVRMWPIGSVTQFVSASKGERGQRFGLVEDGWKFSNSGASPGVRQFTGRSTLHAIVCPDDKPHIEVWNPREPGFGARIMRANKRSGKTARIYLYRFRDKNGTDNKERLGSFEEMDFEKAKSIVRSKQAARSTESKGSNQDAKLSLRGALERYLENKAGVLADATVDDYRKKWAILDADKAMGIDGGQRFTEIAIMRELDAQWWLTRFQEVSRSRGRTSAIGLYRVAHAVYAHHLALGNVTANPLVIIKTTQNIKKNRPSKKIVPAAMLPTLWKWLHTDANSATRDFILVALLSGLRASVIGQLRWEQVRCDRRTYLVPAEERGNKAKVQVEVPIARVLWERVFEPRLKARYGDDKWVIGSARHAEKPAVSVRSAMEGLKRTLGVDCSPQALRRSFGSLAQIATGGDALLVSRMLTHSTQSTTGAVPSVTAGYIHFEERELRAAFEKTAEFILEQCLPAMRQKVA